MSLQNKIFEEVKKEKLDEYIQNLAEQELVELFYKKSPSFLDGLAQKSKIYICEQKIKNMFGDGSVITASYPLRNRTFKIKEIKTDYVYHYDGKEEFEIRYICDESDSTSITFTFDENYELNCIDGVSIVPGMIKFSN